MKANILTVLGVGLPLAIMMMLWRWLDAAPRDSRAAAASRPATTLGPSDREALRGHPALRQFSMVSSPAARQPSSPAMALLDTLDEYAAQWEEAARSDPAYPRVAALALLRRGRYEAAVQAFDRLLVREPDDVGLATGKAMALAGLGRYDDALPLFEHVARTDARDLAAQFNYAVALMRSAEREAAIGTFRGVLELDPGHAKARFNLALLLQAVGRSGEALDVWRQLTGTTEPAASSAPASAVAALSAGMSADAWSHRGELALELGQPPEAETCFLNLARIEPRSAQAWCNVGIARAQQVRRDDALTALNIALQLDPRLVAALNQSAYIQAANYRDTGNPAYRQAVLDYCRRSLEVEYHQPNIIALRAAVRQFDPDEPGPASPPTR